MNNKINLALIFACFCVLSAFQPSKAAGEIGIIDNAKILDKYPASVEAQQKITDAREGLQKTFTSLATDLDKVKQDKSLTEAQKADKTKVAYETALHQAEEHAASFVQDTMQQIAADATAQIAVAAETVHASLDSAVAGLESEKLRALSDIRQSSDDFVREIVAILLGKPTDKPKTTKREKG